MLEHGLHIAAAQRAGADAALGHIQFRATAHRPLRLQAERLRVIDDVRGHALVGIAIGLGDGRGKAAAADIHCCRGRHEAAGVGVGAHFQILAVGELERVGGVHHRVHAVVTLGAVGALAVVHTGTDHAVVARPLQSRLDQVLEAALGHGGAVIEHRTDIAFVAQAGVQCIGAIQREPVLAGLQIFPAVRHFRLTHTHAVFALLVEEDIGVGVAQLRKVGGGGASGRAGKIRLEIQRHMLVEIATQHQARTADAQALVVADKAVARRAQVLRIAADALVVTDLGVAAQAEFVVPLLAGVAGLGRRWRCNRRRHRCDLGNGGVRGRGGARRGRQRLCGHGRHRRCRQLAVFVHLHEGAQLVATWRRLGEDLLGLAVDVQLQLGGQRAAAGGRAEGAQNSGEIAFFHWSGSCKGNGSAAASIRCCQEGGCTAWKRLPGAGRPDVAAMAAVIFRFDVSLVTLPNLAVAPLCHRRVGAMAVMRPT